MNRKEGVIVESFLGRLQQPVNQILDLPSGAGRFTPLLRGCAAVRLVCGDIQQRNLDALKQAESDQGTILDVRYLDIFEPLPFADGEFELAFNFRFFHHIWDAGQRRHVVAELSRVSSRYLIVSYYDTVALHAWQKRLWNRKGHTRALPMIARVEFARLFAGCGFSIVEDVAVVPLIHAHRVALLERS